MTALYIILAAVVYIGLFFLTYTLMCIASDADAQSERDFDIFANARTCYTCAHHLGGGQCRQNLESECAEGEFEAWEPR